MSPATVADAKPRAESPPVRCWITQRQVCVLLSTFPARVLELARQGHIRTMTPPPGPSGKSNRRYALADVERLASEMAGPDPAAVAG